MRLQSEKGRVLNISLIFESQADEATIRGLLDAAVQAPTAIHEEPWAVEVVAPIIVGVPSTAAVDSPRRPPDILAWK